MWRVSIAESGFSPVTLCSCQVTSAKRSLIASDALSVAAKQIEVYLSQADTLALARGAVKIQANWTFEDGSRAASSIVTYAFGPQLLNRVVE